VNKKIQKVILGLVLGLLIIIPSGMKADNGVTIVRGKITKVISQESQTVPGTEIPQVVQKLEVQITEGVFKGRVIQIDNDIVPLNDGDRVNLALSVDENGNPDIKGIGFAGAYRLPALGWLTALFVALVFIFGGWQGIRGLASLAGSLALIIFALLPGLLHGFSPVALSIGVSALIIVLGSYITHGFNRTTTAAVIGMVITVSIVGLFALFAVHVTHLSGMESEETLYLSAGVSGGIDLIGLLLGGILIGLLGVLYDIAIGQAISVEELRRASPAMHAKDLYKRATRIGREHIGALVNTLAIAYVGASLPLLLLFYAQGGGGLQTLNNEIFATEIVRTLVGSIGLVIATPIATIVAVAMLKNRNFSGPSEHSHHH
jgi:uncharacterized membrane protein